MSNAYHCISPGLGTNVTCIHNTKAAVLCIAFDTVAKFIKQLIFFIFWCYKMYQIQHIILKSRENEEFIVYMHRGIYTTTNVLSH